MTRAELEEWLAARVPPAPDMLRRHLDSLLDDGPEPFPDHFASLARATLERVLRAPDGGRELALDVLAADAFVTYAFEAQVMIDVSGLESLASRIAAREGPAAS